MIKLEITKAELERAVRVMDADCQLICWVEIDKWPVTGRARLCLTNDNGDILQEGKNEN